MNKIYTLLVFMILSNLIMGQSLSFGVSSRLFHNELSNSLEKLNEPFEIKSNSDLNWGTGFILAQKIDHFEFILNSIMIM